MKLIDADELKIAIRDDVNIDGVNYAKMKKHINDAKTVDAVEVVHGRWGIIGGDLHSNGYPVVCTICNKAHFVHYKNSLGGLNLNELFELPKYCPNCGTKMGGDD